MGWGLSVFLVGVSLGLLQVGVGVAIGRWSPWGWNKRRAAAIDPRRLRRFVQGLSRCVSTVADEVGEHQSQMGELNERLATAQADGGEGLTEVVLDTVSSIMDINGKLQNRLTEAEDKLRWQAEQIASHLAAARTDPLTGLPNRRAFDDQLYRCLTEWTTRQTPVSLVMIDADRFKVINDTHGHLVGDQVLRDVPRRSAGEPAKPIWPRELAAKSLPWCFRTPILPRQRRRPNGSARRSAPTRATPNTMTSIPRSAWAWRRPAAAKTRPR